MSHCTRISREELNIFSALRRATPAEALLSTTLSLGNPWEVATAVAVRHEQLEWLPTAGTVPCDLHALGLGEPNERFCTKVAGLPYRPRYAKWPIYVDGTPYLFLCQFNFSESRDLFGSLPGDVLLVFSRTGIPQTETAAEMYFEWQSLGLSDLPTTSDVPRFDWEWFCGYGRPCRTFDFVDVKTVVAEFERRLVSCSDWQDTIPAYTWNAARFLGLKIGGLPCWQADSPSDALWGNGFFPDQDSNLSLTYLGGLGTIGPKEDIKMPWLNIEFPIPFSEVVYPSQFLNFYDGFYVHLFLDLNDEVRWALEFP